MGGVDVSKRRLITAEELAKHNTEKDCWIEVHGLVMDVTEFLAEYLFPHTKK